MSKQVIAIFCSDLHLSHNAPIWRSAEPDWYAAMKRPLDEIKKIQDNYEECPIFFAGDLFDKWNSPPELINFAMDNLPRNIFAIPGQHDLPLHNIEDIEKSAYQTLIKAGKISPLSYNGECNTYGRLALWAYPFGFELEPLPEDIGKVNILLAHEYTWMAGCSYKDAPEESNILSKKGKLRGYDIAVFGDNHIGFRLEKKNITIFNCGSIMRRNADQKDYRPMVGLLTEDGEVLPRYLDTSEDKFMDISSDGFKTSQFNSQAFLEELEKLGATSLDFTESIRQYMDTNKTPKDVRNIIDKILERKS